MIKLLYEYEDYELGRLVVKSKKFDSREKALAYAKKKYFNPKDEWYDDVKEELIGDYDVTNIQEVCDIDFKEFCENNKFDFNDGMHIVATLTLKEC